VCFIFNFSVRPTLAGLANDLKLLLYDFSLRCSSYG
jgi:hypothetical protein